MERRQRSGTTHFATVGEKGRSLEDIALAQVGEDMAGLLIDTAVGGDGDFQVVDPLPADGGVDQKAHLAALFLQRDFGAVPIGRI